MKWKLGPLEAQCIEANVSFMKLPAPYRSPQNCLDLTHPQLSIPQANKHILVTTQEGCFSSKMLQVKCISLHAVKQSCEIQERAITAIFMLPVQLAAFNSMQEEHNQMALTVAWLRWTGKSRGNLDNSFNHMQIIAAAVKLWYSIRHNKDGHFNIIRKKLYLKDRQKCHRAMHSQSGHDTPSQDTTSMLSDTALLGREKKLPVNFFTFTN